MAENLHKTAREIIHGDSGPMSAYEFGLWNQYRQKHGFATDRLEWVTANAGSAICHANGSRVTADRIVPHFGAATMGTRKLCTMLGALPGVKVKFTPKDKARPVLTGAEALAEIDSHREGRPDARKTLDSGRPTKPARLKTLGGD